VGPLSLTDDQSARDHLITAGVKRLLLYMGVRVDDDELSELLADGQMWVH
jgi:hypothetical protein